MSGISLDMVLPTHIKGWTKPLNVGTLQCLIEYPLSNQLIYYEEVILIVFVNICKEQRISGPGMASPLPSQHGIFQWLLSWFYHFIMSIINGSGYVRNVWKSLIHFIIQQTGLNTFNTYVLHKPWINSNDIFFGNNLKEHLHRK